MEPVPPPVKRSLGSREATLFDDLPIPHARWQRVIGELKLSARQAEIVAGVLQAQTDKEIAQHMGLKTPTIRTYLERICKRLGVHGRIGLVIRILCVAENQRCKDCHNNQ